MRIVFVLLILLCVLSAFIFGAWLGFDYGSRGARFTSAKTSYAASTLLRNNKISDALIWTDGELLYILPALHDAAASRFFSSLPFTGNPGNLEKHILEYFSLYRPPSTQLPVDYFDKFQDTSSENKKEMKSWLTANYANQKKAFDLIEAYKARKSAEQDAAANP